MNHESSLTIINHANPIGLSIHSVTPMALPQPATARLVVVHVVVDVTVHDALDSGRAQTRLGISASERFYYPTETGIHWTFAHLNENPGIK